MLARCCSQVICFGVKTAKSCAVPAESRYGPDQARWMFQWAIACLPQLMKKKGERHIGDVRWFDEYADLGDDSNTTHESMIREDQRLRASHIWRSPLRKDVFEEIVKHRRAVQQVRASTVSHALLWASSAEAEHRANTPGCRAYYSEIYAALIREIDPRCTL
jgi:hypothetical protein